MSKLKEPFKIRAKSIALGTYVIGNYSYNNNDNTHFIHWCDEDGVHIETVDPATRAIHFSSWKDGGGTPIFASLDEEKGIGGDLLYTGDHMTDLRYTYEQRTGTVYFCEVNGNVQVSDFMKNELGFGFTINYFNVHKPESKVLGIQE